MELRNDVVELKLLPHDVLHPFQGDLKDLSKENFERMKRQILDLGFSEPFTVWLNRGLYMILNGHQRHRVIGQMAKEGYEIPLLPVVVVNAKDELEAKKKVLALTSQYGELTSQGLYEFLETSHIPLEYAETHYNFPSLKFEDFKNEFLDNTEEFGKPALKKCPSCGHEF